MELTELDHYGSRICRGCKDIQRKSDQTQSNKTPVAISYIGVKTQCHCFLHN